MKRRAGSSAVTNIPLELEEKEKDKIITAQGIYHFFEHPTRYLS